MSQATRSPDAPTGSTISETPPTEPDPRALDAAADAVRRLVAHVRKSNAPAEVLDAVAQEANRLADKLAPHDHPGPYSQRRLFLSLEQMNRETDVPAEFFRYSPVVGRHNPVSPPIDFRLVEKEIHAEHVFDAPYTGPPTAVHGGIVALVFDELLGCTGVMNDCPGFTGTLSVRYCALTPIGHPIRMRGWVDRVDGRKITIRGTMHDGKTLSAEAEGLFIRPKESMMADAIAKNEAR